MPQIDINTRFRDIAEAEEKTVARLRNDQLSLQRMLSKVKALSNDQQEELDRITSILKIREASKVDPNDPDDDRYMEAVNPLFVAARTLLNSERLSPPKLLWHDKGVFQWGAGGNQGTRDGLIAANTVVAALTMGLLVIDGAVPPPVMVVDQSGNQTGVMARGKGNGKTIYPDIDHPHMGTFTRDFYEAAGEASSFGQLATNVFALLAQEGDQDAPGGAAFTPTVDVAEYASVMRGLKKRGVTVNEPQLRRRVNEALDEVQNVGSFDKVVNGGIELPDLEELTDTNIVKENIRVMGPMIVSAMFEELKVYQVVDRIVEQFQRGMLPIGSGSAGRLLYNYWREAPNRMSEQERRDFQMITLGVPGGNPNSLVNRDFNDLWIRFVSSVSSFIRQNDVDSLLRSSTPGSVSQQQVRKAARDLASNLTLHGYGMAHYAARELQSQIKFMIDLLQDPEILGAYGSRDMWQVIDQVATYDLGGAKTSSRYRTLATCGTIITEWLAKNATRISRPTGPLIDLAEVRNPQIAQGPNHKATVDPTDYDLVNACELWLADTATSDMQVEELAQPREAPTMTSKPIPIPAMARDMLDGIGVSLGNTRH